jgi:hypothetical protein
VAGWRRGGLKARRSGLGLAVATFPMIASGYLLQIAVEASWRLAWGWIHTGVALAWLAGMAVHVLARARCAGASPIEEVESMQPKTGGARS